MQYIVAQVVRPNNSWNFDNFVFIIVLCFSIKVHRLILGYMHLILQLMKGLIGCMVLINKTADIVIEITLRWLNTCNKYISTRMLGRFAVEMYHCRRYRTFICIAKFCTSVAWQMCVERMLRTCCFYDGAFENCTRKQTRFQDVCLELHVINSGSFIYFVEAA